MRCEFLACFYSDLKKTMLLSCSRVLAITVCNIPHKSGTNIIFNMLCIIPTVKKLHYYNKCSLVSSFVAKFINLSNYKCISRSELLQ